MDPFSDMWISEFRNIIYNYENERAPDPFMIWFRQKDSQGFFANEFERVLVVLINSRFDQRTTADKALENTKAVVRTGVLKEVVSKEEIPLLIPKRQTTAKQWTEMFCSCIEKFHEQARKIVEKRYWDAADLLDFMLIRCKVPYLGVKTSRLAVRWLHELVPYLNIEMTTYKIPIDSLVFRVASRIGIIDPKEEPYKGKNSPADIKIQSFVKRIAPNRPYILDEPMWATGRRAKDGGHCFPTEPNCWRCLFEKVCQRNFLHEDPEKIATNKEAPISTRSIRTTKSRINTEKQKQFAQFVKELKEKEITGKEYREQISKWQEDHK